MRGPGPPSLARRRPRICRNGASSPHLLPAGSEVQSGARPTKFMPSCKTCPMGPDGQASQVLAGHVPVTRSRGSMPAITATRVGATPPPSLAPPEPWDGALSPRPHRPGAWARGMGPPFTLRAGGKETQRRIEQADADCGLRGGGRRLCVWAGEGGSCSGSPNRTSTWGREVGPVPTHGGENSAQRHTKQPQVLR